MSKHRRVTGSGIALSITTRVDPLHDTVSACVRCHSKLWGITNPGSDWTGRDIFGQAGAKAAVQIKSQRDRPITIQQHTPSGRGERGREGQGEGGRERSVLYFFRPDRAVVRRAANSILMVLPSETVHHGDLQ